MDPELSAEFGCPRCWPPVAEEAWRADRERQQVAELIDDLHLGVNLLGCASCGQRFLSVFEEEVDWADGDDPQYWSILPLTAEEALSLLQASERISKADLNALGPGRRSLRHHHPKGQPPRDFWGVGVSIP